MSLCLKELTLCRALWVVPNPGKPKTHIIHSTHYPQIAVPLGHTAACWRAVLHCGTIWLKTPADPCPRSCPEFGHTSSPTTPLLPCCSGPPQCCQATNIWPVASSRASSMALGNWGWKWFSPDLNSLTLSHSSCFKACFKGSTWKSGRSVSA